MSRWNNSSLVASSFLQAAFSSEPWWAAYRVSGLSLGYKALLSMCSHSIHLVLSTVILPPSARRSTRCCVLTLPAGVFVPVAPSASCSIVTRSDMAGGQLHLLSPGPVMEPPEARPQLATYSGDRSLGAAYVSLCELEVALRTIRTL